MKYTVNDLQNEDIQSLQEKLFTCNDKNILHKFALEYNWDNGFGIPKSILANSNCTLGTALALFFQSDGYRYLIEKPIESELPDWVDFIESLYANIRNGKYQDKSVPFSIPLSKIQLYKLKKLLSEEEHVFINDIN